MIERGITLCSESCIGAAAARTAAPRAVRRAEQVLVTAAGVEPPFALPSDEVLLCREICPPLAERPDGARRCSWRESA